MFKKTKKSIGLEISDTSIKVLEIITLPSDPRGEGGQSKSERTISASAELLLDVGVVENGLIQDPKELAKKIKLVFKKASLGSPSGRVVHFALPDVLVRTHVFRASIGQNISINKIVASKYKKYIPFSSQVGEYAFKVIDKHKLDNDKQIPTVILVAAKKKSLLLWQDFFESQKIKIEFFDIGVLASFRAIFDKRQNKAIAILDIKNSYSKFAIFSSHGLEYEASLELGTNDSADDFRSLVTKHIDKATNIIAHEGGGALLIDEVALSGNIDDDLLEAMDKLNFKFNFREVVIGKEKLDSKYFQVLGLAERNISHYFENRDPFLPLLGHAYSLKAKVAKGDQVYIDVPAILKKFILMPILVIVFVSFAWWFMGTIQTSVESERGKNVEEVQEEKPENKLPVYMQTKEVEKKIYIRVDEIGMPLNVRGGPSTSYDIIGQADPGSEQVLIKKKDDWYNIKWPNTDNAWISASYAKIIE